MGDAADMIIEGVCCQYCGEVLDEAIETGEGCGYPSSCAACSDESDEIEDDEMEKLQFDNDRLVLIPLPPLSKYPKPLEDQSTSTAEKCVDCGKYCWVSIRKKTVMQELKHQNIDFYAGCYDCIEMKIKNNPKLVKDCKMFML